MTAITRASLLARVYMREKKAKDEFAAIYLPVITRYAKQFTIDHGDDIAQDVVTKFCVEEPIQYDPNRGRFRHLLMTAVRCRFLDRIKKLKQERPLPNDWAEQIPDDINDITEKELERAEVRFVYNEIRNDFEPQTRNIFEQYYFDEKTVTNIATEFGITVEAVRAATKRVRDRLREEFDKRK